MFLKFGFGWGSQSRGVKARERTRKGRYKQSANFGWSDAFAFEMVKYAKVLQYLPTFCNN